MGEYAKFGGEQIKIGTCENMYYLRADQAHMVQAVPGNVDPVKDAGAGIRFRFPWPDEDGHPPGSFERYERSAAIHGVPLPEDEFEHDSVQFTSQIGFLLSIPCPLSKAGKELAEKVGIKLHKNGYAGDFQITQQRLFEGNLVVIGCCGGCGAKFRLPTLAHATPIVEACLAEADKRIHCVESQKDPSGAIWWMAVAERILDGYRGKHPFTGLVGALARASAAIAKAGRP